MRLSQKIALSIAIIAATGVALYATRRRCADSKDATLMLNRIADEGYETAQDVLFPGKNIQEKRVHYGPVIPGI